MALDDPPQFPAELIEMIIKNGSDDTRTLASCSLVCCSWSPIARAQRFHRLSITPRSDTPPRCALLLCDPTSTVLPYVRRLHLTLEIPPGLERGEDGRPRRPLMWPKLAPWLDDVLPAIRVKDLTALEHLSVSRFQWNQLSVVTRRSLVSLCARVVALDLSATAVRSVPCSAVVEVLKSATSLRHFKLVCPEWLPFSPDESFEPLTHPGAPMELRLSSFEIDNSSRPYLLGLHSLSPVLHLKSVSVRGIKEDDVEPLVAFLRSCTARLEHLRLGFSPGGWLDQDSQAAPELSFCAHGGLSRIISLRSLALEARLPHMPAILRQVDSPNLAEVEIRTGADAFSGSDLGELSRSLSTGVLAAALPRVTFVGLPSPDWAVSYAEALQGMRDALLARLTDLQGRKLRFMRVMDSVPGEIEERLEEI